MISASDEFAQGIVTLSQRDGLVEGLREIVSNLYQTATPLRKNIESTFMPQQAEWLLKTIKQPLNNERLHSTETLLMELIDQLMAIRICTLTVATAPTLTQIISIHEWLVQTMRANCIIDLKINRSLIAGAQIQFDGKYIDKSLKLTLTNDEILRSIS